MNRAFLVVLGLLAFGSVFTGSAATQTTCVLEPVSGSERAIVGSLMVGERPPSENIRFQLLAMWMATARCPGSPLDNQRVEFMQTARLRGFLMPIEDVFSISGRAKIEIDFPSAGFQARFRGQLRGTMSCDSADICALELDLDARSPHGAHLRGHQNLLLDLNAGTVIAFTTDDIIGWD
jgi:hypothetical protein